MTKSRVAEWILAQVLPPDRAASMVGDWMEDIDHRGNTWFWSCVFRTLLSRVWSDFAESPGFLVGLALRGWLYSCWLLVGTYFGLFAGVCILVPLALLAGYLTRQLHWHPSWPVSSAFIAQVWIGACQFQAGRWIARRARGRELAAGIVACMTPTVFFFLLQLVSMHFRGSKLDLPATLPSEIFLLAGILWFRQKSLRSVAQ